MHYSNIIQSTSVAEPQTQDKDLSVWVPVLQSTQPVEVPCEQEKAEPGVPAILGVCVRPQIPKIYP